MGKVVNNMIFAVKGRVFKVVKTLLSKESRSYQFIEVIREYRYDKYRRGNIYSYTPIVSGGKIKIFEKPALALYDLEDKGELEYMGMDFSDLDKPSEEEKDVKDIKDLPLSLGLPS